LKNLIEVRKKKREEKKNMWFNEKIGVLLSFGLSLFFVSFICINLTLKENIIPREEEKKIFFNDGRII